LGLERPDALAEFCLELSSDHPSPGGGTASAAAGAMAASLLMMVCGITARSKKHEDSANELSKHKDALAQIRDELIRLAAEDAAAYDQVVEALRRRREDPGRDADRRVEEAIAQAARVPLSTAADCLRVMAIAADVARLGARSASSDTGVAVLLADVGFKGAAMNVRVNLKSISDRAFAADTEKALARYELEASEKTSLILEALRQSML
jgi:formiminotetrahydrofolate cyclodeaminase